MGWWERWERGQNGYISWCPSPRNTEQEERNFILLKSLLYKQTNKTKQKLESLQLLWPKFQEGSWRNNFYLFFNCLVYIWTSMFFFPLQEISWSLRWMNNRHLADLVMVVLQTFSDMPEHYSAHTFSSNGVFWQENL